MLTFLNLGRYGRLGNQMFQIASTIGIATRHGYDYGFPYWMNFDARDRFASHEDIDVQSWFAHPLPLVADGTYNTVTIDFGYHEPSLPDWTNINGYLQSERYFLHCAELIRHYFTFKRTTPKQPDTLAIHFRGGDYGSAYHPRCTEQYYRSALEHFDCKRILVFSDEPTRAKQLIGTNAEYVEGNHTLTDLELMTQCDHHIIANSSFSWWGAWLAESKKVVAPKTWFGPASNLNAMDIYCERWIAL